MIRRAVMVVPAVLMALACAGAGEAPNVVPLPAEVAAVPAPAPAAAELVPAADVWTEVEPSAVFPALCGAFSEDGAVSGYEDSYSFVHTTEGRWTREGDVVHVAWKEVTRSTGLSGDTDHSGPSQIAHEASLRLHKAFRRGVDDGAEAMLLTTAVGGACDGCATLLHCTQYASHEGGYNGDTWFGPSDPPDVWAEVIDAGGGVEGTRRVLAALAGDRAFAFSGAAAKNPRDGIEVLHRLRPEVVEKANGIAKRLDPLGVPLKLTPWAEAPQPIVIAVGRLP